jgi:hypothetical protein
VTDDVRDLIERAFVATRPKRGEHWRRMTLGELKARMLELSRQTFKESHYGASSFKAFVEKMSDVLALDLSAAVPIAELKQQQIKNPPSSSAAEPPLAPEARAENKLDHYRSKGDRLAVGEIVADAFDKNTKDMALAIVISSWASTSANCPELRATRDIATHVDQFLPSNLASAIVHTAVRLRRTRLDPPSGFTDLAYKMSKDIETVFGVSGRGGSSDALKAAATKLEDTTSLLQQSVGAFKRSTAVTAKQPSIEVVRQAHRYYDFALPGEKQLIREVDVLLGPVFRKFCEACERHEVVTVPKRAAELRKHIQRLQESYRDDTPYEAWRSLLLPLLEHVISLVEDGSRGTAEQTAPAVSVKGGTTFKLDLAADGRTITFPVRISNTGQGTAFAVTFSAPAEGPALAIAEPSGPFDLLPGGERLVTLALRTPGRAAAISIPVRWNCTSAIGKTCDFTQQLTFAQQTVEPNWEAFRAKPPYAINPIKDRKELFGRDTILTDLAMNVAGGVSTFLWGQKRVGKTSVLQVLASELAEQPGTRCIVLRMGELASLHEGQIAHTIASRLLEQCKSTIACPTEEFFGAGMGRLVPLIERLAREKPRDRLLVIIDEFDDLDPAFYTGERGRQFVKALRSLSEVGLTLFFVGSERMDAIYAAHSSDLNKWVNASLDRLTSEEDCAALISRPVAGAIEFHPESIRWISRYCGGNPFYMHLLCNAVFRRCFQEHRTYVGECDVEDVHRDLLGTLGPTNFAHLWEDNPELRLGEKQRQTAENSVFLACCAALGGSYENIDDLSDAQTVLKLPAAQRLSAAQLKEVEGRLVRRGVLNRGAGGGFAIDLPIFRDWLMANADAHLVPVWRRYADDEALRKGPTEGAQLAIHVEPLSFPIPEDDLLPIADKLVYLGKQKDVAEIRRWLRQFDDDSRIEIAFLLLKRLAERGFVNQGASISVQNRMQEVIQAERLKIGGGSWHVVRGRNDNLCITFVDSDTKSGAVTARELAKRLRPGKCGSFEEIQPWLKSHMETDPLLVIADDFSGTGTTASDGLSRLRKLDPDSTNRLIKEGRVVCCVQSAFPEASETIRSQYPTARFVAIETFGEDVRALDESAAIFESEGDLRFAKDALLQIGRQLWPQHPLGYGDIGGLVAFHNTVPNNTLPIFWCAGTVNNRQWLPLLPRASYS